MFINDGCIELAFVGALASVSVTPLGVFSRSVMGIARMQINHPKGPTPTQLVIVNHLVHGQTLHRRSGHFCESMSCSRIALCKLSSATNFFNRVLLIMQLFEFAYLIRLNACALLLPAVIRVLGYPDLTGPVRYRYPKTRLLENRRDRLNRNAFLLQDKFLDRLAVSVPEN
jgi:hypothetical protein